MSRRKKTSLIVVVSLLVAIGMAIPFAQGPVLLYWAKRQAHRAYARLDPETLRNMNAVPTMITLPAPAGGPLTVKESSGYLIHVPQSQSYVAWKGAVIFKYLQFEVLFLKPFSTAANSAGLERLYHMNSFEYESAMYRARPDDIDAQPDLASLKQLVTLLADKPNGAAFAAYFAQFSGPDRRGFIMAVDADRHRVHAEIQFPKTGTDCGMYFNNPGGVSIKAVRQFLADLQIEPKPATASAPVIPR